MPCISLLCFLFVRCFCFRFCFFKQIIRCEIWRKTKINRLNMFSCGENYFRRYSCDNQDKAKTREDSHRWKKGKGREIGNGPIRTKKLRQRQYWQRIIQSRPKHGENNKRMVLLEYIIDDWNLNKLNWLEVSWIKLYMKSGIRER